MNTDVSTNANIDARHRDSAGRPSYKAALTLLAVSLGAVCAKTSAQAVTSFTYDANNRVVSITDPRGLITTFTMDGLGKNWQTSSPDTGVTTANYDSYGRVSTSTRADGVTTSYGYDALNRVVSVNAGGQIQVITYDTCTGGATRLCGTSDSVGSSSYSYTPQGRLVSHLSTIGATNYALSYTYNNLGQLASIGYPDGSSVSYNYTNGAVTSVQVSALGINQNAVSSISYAAGDTEMTQWSTANGLTTTAGYDNDGRLTRLLVPGVQDVTFGYDAADRLVHITDAIDTPMTQAFGYDDMSRLTVVNSAADTEAFQYDASGNRTTETINGLVAMVATSSTSNRLTGLSGGANVSYGYDPNGNITTIGGSPTFHFDAFNRLDNATNASYYVGVEGERLRKTVGGTSTYFSVDKSGLLMAESSGGGWTDYIWLNGRLVARLVSGQIESIHTDQTGRPNVVTNASGTVVWRSRNYAFDRIVSLATTSPLNVGFPGQYYDQESGLWNNGFRDYSASLGRYIESDPIGLQGGINTYAYVGSSPLGSIDMFGLCDCDGAVPTAPADDDLNKDIASMLNLKALGHVAGPGGDFLVLSVFYSLEKGRGPWDFKQQGAQYQDYGNFHYGVAGAAAGIPTGVLLRAAGYAQIRAGTSEPTWGNPLTGAPFGDDPADQDQIMKGIWWYANCYGK